MKKYNIVKSILLACSLLLCGVAYTSCDEEELDTNQFTGGVSLNAYGPCPVARGGELQFIGNGMDQITSITLPGCPDITEINKISKTKISIIVPKTAQPGFPVLHYAKGDITTKSKLNYTEPVGFAESNAFQATAIKPGETLTIKGTYLNLVESVIFSDGVKVIELEKSSADEPMDMTIKVVVPAEAKTGKLFLGFIATGDTLMNKVLSEAELIVTLPSVKEVVKLDGKKPGDAIEIEGTDLDLVTKVTVADADVKFTVKEGKISFELPASTPAEAIINMYPASEVPVLMATIGMKTPTDVAATPDKDLRNGNEITISGKDLDVVDKIKFPGVEEAVSATLSDGVIRVKCPDNFQSGDLVLICKSGFEYKLAIATQKPTLESFSPVPVPAGSNLTIKGQNLDLVKSIEFPEGLKVDKFVGQSATELVVTVPVAAVSGDLTLTMGNGETVKFEKLTVDSPIFCFISEMPGEEAEIKAGQIITVPVVNGDKLTGIEIDGHSCQFILDGENLMIKVPETAGKRSVIKLISSNGEVEYAYAFIPNSNQKRVVWSGMTELTWNDGGRVFIPASALDNVPDDAILHLCYTMKDKVWCQAQINDGWWGKILNWASDDECEGNTNGEGALVPTDVHGWFGDGYDLNKDTKFRLTAEKLKWLREHVGDDGSAMVIQGSDVIFTQVYITWVISSEKTISKAITVNSWDPIVRIDSEYDWSQASAGQIVRVYAKRDPEITDYNNFKVVDPWWATAVACFFTAEGIEDDETTTRLEEKVFEIELTKDMIGHFRDHGGMSAGGHGVIIDKVTIE